LLDLRGLNSLEVFNRRNLGIILFFLGRVYVFGEEVRQNILAREGLYLKNTKLY